MEQLTHMNRFFDSKWHMFISIEHKHLLTKRKENTKYKVFCLNFGQSIGFFMAYTNVLNYEQQEFLVFEFLPYIIIIMINRLETCFSRISSKFLPIGFCFEDDSRMRINYDMHICICIIVLSVHYI